MIIHGLATSQPTYPAEKHVAVYVGVNDFNLDTLQLLPELEYRGVDIKHVVLVSSI